MKNYILGFISCLFLTSVLVYAVNVYNAREISFSSVNSSWDVTNVSDAIDDLYNLSSSKNIKYKFYLNGTEMSNYQSDYLLYKVHCNNNSFLLEDGKLKINNLNNEGDVCSFEFVSPSKILNDEDIRKESLKDSGVIELLDKTANTVPVLSNNTNVIFGNAYSNSYTGYMAFDNDTSTRFASSSNAIPNYIGYQFDSNISVYKVYWINAGLNENIKTYKIQYYDNDSSEWKDATDVLTSSDTSNFAENTIILNKTYISNKWRLYIVSSTSDFYVNLVTIQFYGIEV